jgi:Transcription factor WhiB
MTSPMHGLDMSPCPPRNPLQALQALQPPARVADVADVAQKSEDTMTASKGRIASDKLTRALLTAAATGVLPHCADPDDAWRWLSEDANDRRIAAALCSGCPVIEPCGEAAKANRESFGVWSGVDRTRAPGRKKEELRAKSMTTIPRTPVRAAVKERKAVPLTHGDTIFKEVCSRWLRE